MLALPIVHLLFGSKLGSVHSKIVAVLADTWRYSTICWALFRPHMNRFRFPTSQTERKTFSSAPFPLSFSALRSTRDPCQGSIYSRLLSLYSLAGCKKPWGRYVDVATDLSCLFPLDESPALTVFVLLLRHSRKTKSSAAELHMFDNSLVAT